MSTLERSLHGHEQGFSHVARVTAGGATTLYVSGQVGLDPASGAPGKDLAEQAAFAFRALLRRLGEAGASARDVVKTTVFIKDIDPGKVRAVGRAQRDVLQVEPYPASTWVGVTGLVMPELLVEVEAIAVIAAP